MMLLHLPLELIQLVLQNASTPTYLQAAFACRTLYEIASSCRTVILHHLYQTPGLTSNVQHLETRRLFQLLVKRSLQQLHGAQFRANSKTFGFESQAIDVHASSLALFGNPNLVLVTKGQPDVFLFQVGNGGLLLPRTRLKLPWEQPGTVEVLKTTFPEDHDVYVLYRLTPTIEKDDPDGEHPFVKHALQSNSSGMVYLAHFDLRSPYPNVRMCAFPDHVNYEALAFAVADQDTFAISWKHVHENSGHEVSLYTVLDETPNEASKITEFEYNSYILMDGDEQFSDSEESLQARLDGSHHPHKQRPVIDLCFNDRSSQLLYYYRAQTLYGSFQRINTSSLSASNQPTLHRNSCMVPFSNSLSLRFSIAIPFFGTHRTITRDGVEMCNWKYLSFGVATHRKENWTVACLLRSEAFCQSRNCGHVLNLDRGRRFSEWTIVGRLWGFQDSKSSLGCTVAASPRGTRIAVANWNSIYIWALEPNALIEEDTDGFYPPSSRSPSTGVVELRPVVLQLNGVCFKLRFMDQEDELLALTDRGVMNWDLGPLARGERTIHPLRV